MALRGSILVAFFFEVDGHGMVTLPPSRHGGNLSYAGMLSGYGPETNLGSYWFSQPMAIPGEPTLTEEFRTFNVKVTDGVHDWSRKMPWRSPGSAPVRGSGCGVAGGAPVKVPNGGEAPEAYVMGMDGSDLPAMMPTVWQLGSTVEVAWAMYANHGGGYSYRLCKKSDNISEACFQNNVLRFHGNSSWIQYSDLIYVSGEYMKLPRFEIPRVLAPEDQVHPKGSHWARNPIPSCYRCDQSACGNLMPNLTEPISNSTDYYGGDAWLEQEMCAQNCSGGADNSLRCLPGMTQFPEPLSGLSGYSSNLIGDLDGRLGSIGFQFSIVDEVIVPMDLHAGDYVLSWRWDCEQSNQIWQNCADVQLVEPAPFQV